MGQFARAVTGIGDACRALAFPIVSGNVSLYNETNGAAIPPTPAIGGVGLVPDLAHTATIALKAEGNLLVALAEMCVAGGTGAEIAQPAGNPVPSHAFFYGEDQARYLVASGAAEEIVAEAQKAGVPAALLGYTGGASLTVKGLLSLKLSDIKAAHEAWLPGYMNATE